jgi:glycosyltransferase involved in cell wall biosynthesis
MPVIHHENYAFSLDDDAVVGGVEMFQKLVYKNIPDIIPVYITYEDRMKRRVKQVMQAAIAQHKPDLIFTNHFATTYTLAFQQFGIPVVWLQHMPAVASHLMLNSCKAMVEFVNNGGLIYFVSDTQHTKINKIAKRTLDVEIPCAGFINPFFVHKKLKSTNISRCVITNNPISSGDAQIKYTEVNSKWEDPNFTFRGLNHKDTMDILSASKVYISTCPVESWGITALEALSRGLPCVLVTDTTGTHSSQIIADKDSDYICVSNGCKTEELVGAIEKLSKLTMEDRLDLSNRTKLKHSKSNFISGVTNMLNSALNNTKKMEVNSLDC